jgi:hypothetical protein
VTSNYRDKDRISLENILNEQNTANESSREIRMGFPNLTPSTTSNIYFSTKFT